VNAGDHIGDDAALYALGVLDEERVRSIDAHVATCEPCARALGEAEGGVAGMVAAGPQYAMPAEIVALREPRARRPAWRPALALAVAAALVVGILPSAYFWEREATLHRAMMTDAAAMDRLASSPHRTVAFVGMEPGASAHVMYGPDGSWYVVLVRGASRALRLVWMHDGGRTPLGTAEPYGNVALLYLPKSHRMDRLALMDGERMVAEAQLAY